MAFDDQFRARTAAILGLAVLLMLAACGAAPKAAPSGMMTMPNGTVMSGSQMSAMSGMTGSTSGPSASAKMICSDEIAGAVQRNVSISTVPARHASWANQTYTCNYALAGGGLTLSVKDLASMSAGEVWFRGLRTRLVDPSAIKGMANLGFPAFETPTGDVVFLKDAKTLWVDAAQVPPSLIPPGSSRTGVAYGIAAAVIACWKE